jgi:hypothetical protein
MTDQSKEPLRISFPVVDVSKYSLNQGGRGIILQFAPIMPINADFDTGPLHGEAICFMRNGTFLKITMPAHEFERLKRDPVFFIEAKGIGQAPKGVLLDFQGRTLRGG